MKSAALMLSDELESFELIKLNFDNRLSRDIYIGYIKSLCEKPVSGAGLERKNLNKW